MPESSAGAQSPTYREQLVELSRSRQQLVELARALRRPPARPPRLGLTWSGDPYDAPRTGGEAVQREVDRLVAVYREQRQQVAPSPRRPNPAA